MSHRRGQLDSRLGMATAQLAVDRRTPRSQRHGYETHARNRSRRRSDRAEIPSGENSDEHRRPTSSAQNNRDRRYGDRRNRKEQEFSQRRWRNARSQNGAFGVSAS